MALNPTIYTEKVVRSFLRFQLAAYPFADEGIYAQCAGFSHNQGSGPCLLFCD